MYIVTESGSKIHIDDSELNRKDTYYVRSNVMMFKDDVDLKEVWCVDLWLSSDDPHMDADDAQCLGVHEFNHEPTKEEIMYLLASVDEPYHLIRADVHKSYKMDLFPREYTDTDELILDGEDCEDE